MDLATKLPGMEDAALANLHENAARLEQTGTKTQKSAAAALLPALEAELETRRVAKLAAAKAKRAAARPAAKRPRSGAAKAAPAAEGTASAAGH